MRTRLSKRGIYIASISLIILLVFPLLFLGRQTQGPVVTSLSPSGKNLLKGYDWSDFAGASINQGVVHIEPLGRAIVNQDGSGGQPNPPVNVRGPHLLVRGSFEVTADLSHVSDNSPATLYLFGQVPIIYDEWRYMPHQLRIDVSASRLAVTLWDGTSDNYVFQKSWQITASGKSTVAIVSNSGRIVIVAGGKQLGEIQGKGIFDSGQVWFGADAKIGSPGWDLDELYAAPVSHGSLAVADDGDFKKEILAPSGLRSLSTKNNRNLPIGAAVSNYALFSDGGYRNLVASQFDMITPENEMKPQFIHPQPGIYSFKEADSLVDFALANGMKIHGHTLEFSEANPKWMQDLLLSQRQQVLSSHISTVVKHFGTKVNEWDVVDEPLNDDDNDNGDSSDLRQNIWYAAMGESYIYVAFAAAHAANPNADLYLNEYGLEADGPRWDEFVALLSRLQSRGVPINGVGFQAHVHEAGDEIDEQTLIRHMQLLASMGLKSRISEMDVYGDDPSLQAAQYATGLKSCLVVRSCTSFTMWGITDRYGSTTDIHNYPLDYGNDLVWDSNLQPKEAFGRLQKVLQSS